MQNNYPVLKQRTQMAFCYSFNIIVPYYQLQFVIVHRVWHRQQWQLRHALNIKETWDWLFDCLTVSVQIVKICRNSNDKPVVKNLLPKYTRPETPSYVYWGDLTTHHACVVWGHRLTVPSTLIVTNWAAERSFTSVYYYVHTGERHLRCSVCNYQCRRDCDLKPSNDTCVVISRSAGSSRFHIFYVSQLYRTYVTTLSLRLCRVVKRPLQSLHWYNCLLELRKLDISWRVACVF